MSVEYYKNFEAAFSKLAEFCDGFDGSEIQRAGIIQAFEFSFEQCWKAIQKKAGTEGLSIASPKKAFEWAMAQSWILADEENTWLQLLQDRNLTTHTYREAMAKQVADNIIGLYRPAFKKLLDAMRGVG